MNAARAQHSITLLPSGKVLAAAGGGTLNDFRTAEIYDPLTNVWASTGQLTTPRANHRSILLANGQVLVTGGVDMNGNPIASAELYDPATGQWSTTGNMNTPRTLHTLTLLPNGRVLAAGGVADNLTFNTLNSAELYDPATGVWTLTTTLIEARHNHTATLLSNGKVLVAAGEPRISSASPVTLASAELFDSGMPSVASVSAASFAAGPLTPEAIIAAFGTNLAVSTQVAASLPLPTQLAGISVSIRDSLGIERASPLFFAAPNQINYLIPTGTSQGTAMVTVSSGATGVVEIVRVSPGLFSADASGAGLAAAVILRVKANGEQMYEPVGQFDPVSNKIIPTPIDVSNPAEQVYLILFGTGFRHRSDLANVMAKIDGANSPVLFAGAQGDLVGVDQCNLRLPNSLAGRGDISIALIADGKTSNTVKVRVK